MTQPTLKEMAKKYVRDQGGICLIPKPGKELPSCHEKDFCACDLEKAVLFGARAMGEKILCNAAEVQYLESGTFQGGEEDVFNAGIEHNEDCLVVPAKLKAELAGMEGK